MKDIYKIAIHEAGHAVMCGIMRKGIEFVTIERQGDVLGGVSVTCQDSINYAKTEKEVKRILERECLISFAGCVAEILLTDVTYKDVPNISNEACYDIEYMTDLVKAYYNVYYDIELLKFHMDDTGKKAYATFNDPLVRKQIKAVADALMMKQKISGRTVRRIMKSVADQQAA